MRKRRNEKDGVRQRWGQEEEREGWSEAEKGGGGGVRRMVDDR